jgi:hypothetical protein
MIMIILCHVFPINMVELKTKATDASVEAFLEAVEHPTRKADGLELLEIMKDVTQEKPVMWGTSIVGFGTHHYKYASGREVDWFKVGFSPRKRSLTIYLTPGLDDIDDLREELGKHRVGKGCLYINKLLDVDTDVLKKIIKKSIEVLENRYGNEIT